MPTTIEPSSTEAKDWNAVRFLTRELERSEQLAASIAQWDLTVRLFRAVEQQRFYEQEPTENDRANHQALLHLLIGLGQHLELQATGFSDQQLAAIGIRRADLGAYVQELMDSFFLWYVPNFEPARTAELQRQIFGADP